MNRILFFMIFYMFGTGILIAQQSRFDTANSLLEENSYSEAIQLYKSIADDGYDSGALWLNMGVAYSQVDSLGLAKFYLLKAKNYRETANPAEEALTYVNDRFSRQSAVLPDLPWDRFFSYLSDSYGVSFIAISALIIFYLAVALLIGSWFRVDYVKPLRYSSYTMLITALLIFLLSWIVYYQDNRYDTAVMVGRESTVYEQPREDASVITTAFEGYKLKIDNNRVASTDDNNQDGNDWVYIRLENGMYGWIQCDGLKRL
ncbi:MAG: SH3 domain-containing protein [Balneolaceae bacterium]